MDTSMKCFVHHCFFLGNPYLPMLVTYVRCEDCNCSWEEGKLLPFLLGSDCSCSDVKGVSLCIAL